ncbi:recombination-associated protein RdgC [Pseudobacteriovorax antillogorgiicola]|uniref:Putative exonuclease, RdgC n=1 Tax=Pseudobacteriovorax antillogorgiicola TaxID=1513793 RepID=A0A1Y6B919_9BACT|nr:recombination-associated protein RdgC [Pseudobacteriovorax antillogorgiicola]TCS58571.1 putative exonuclease RdgC [Pseudobacteriovorax antillogorgiicola]SME97381.1 Putative exonuclease, RdgC [Pseudobacteriovorax antillogorgiicola]
MTIFSGSFSASRYHIIGRKSQFKLAELNQKLKTYQARPLQLKSSKELSFGWERPSVIDPEANAETAHWDMSDCQFDEGYLMRIRIEKRKVPSALLQIVFKRKIEELSERNEGKPVSRKQRKDLLEESRLELFEQCLPNVSFADVYWHEERHEVFLFSTSKSIQIIFEELFKKTFCEHLNLSLVKVLPPLLGMSQDEWQSGAKTIDRVSHALPSELVSTSIS